MDPLTHGLVGALAGISVAPRRHVRVAGSVAALAAVVPDADIFIPTGGDPLLALELHRQFSHSLVAIPAIAVLVAAIACAAPRRLVGAVGASARSRFVVLAAYAALGAATAGVLDACTSYGTELLWPFSDRRIAWAIVSVLDPVVTLLAAVAVGLAAARLSPAPATWGAVAVLAYLGLGWIQHERAEFVASTVAADRGHHVERLMVKPAFGTIVLWRSVYLTAESYQVDAVRLGAASDIVVYAGETLPAARADSLPLGPDSIQARDVARFARLAAGYTVFHPTHPWVLGDVRFALLPDRASPLWGVRLSPDAPHEHVRFVTFRKVSPDVLDDFLDMLLGRPLASLRADHPS